MKKIIFLTIACLTLTGCTINYNLEIEDNSFEESITGTVLNEEMMLRENQTDINIFDYLINFEQPALTNNSNALYKKTINKNTNNTDYNYSFTYNEQTISNSRVLNECFENFNFKTENNTYYLTAFGEFYCNLADEIRINITTDYEVPTHNAKNINNNTYTWIINKENTNNLELYMTINKEIKEKDSAISWNIIKTIGLIVLLILSAICIYVVKKKEKY